METEKNTENVWKAEQKNKENVENQAYQISQERALEMLEEFLEQDQFCLLYTSGTGLCALFASLYSSSERNIISHIGGKL